MSNVSSKRRAAAIAVVPLLLIVIGLVVQGVFRQSASIAIGLIGIALLTAGAWWFVTEVGLVKPIAGVIGVVGVLLVLVALAQALSKTEHIVLRLVAVIAVVSLMIYLANFALKRPVPDSSVRVKARPSKPVLLCNPWSGGGKVEKFGLIQLADELGIETVLLDRGLDLEQLTLDAVARGADCLGMAGGDGSQALVASVAVKHDLPFVCIPAGTRNHFALDLGLDRDDPRTAMLAYRDAIERRVDYATVNGRLFVNNVSLGIYATIVQSEDYRNNKVEVSSKMTAELLGRQAETFDLQYTTPDGTEVDGAFVIMVSNNRYVLGAKRDVAQRRRLDAGQLGIFALSPRTGGQAARLMTMSMLGLPDSSKYWWEFHAPDFEVRSRSGSAYMGVDGEALDADTPLRFEIHPLGLRMYVPEGNLDEVERRRARDLRVADLMQIARGHEPGSTPPG
jgi:diacylglycerol kinase family enzyme